MATEEIELQRKIPLYLKQCKRPPQPPDRIPFGGALYEVRVRNFGSPRPNKTHQGKRAPAGTRGSRLRPAYAPLTPAYAQQWFPNLSKADALRMCSRCNVMCYAHDVMCYDDGKLTMINIAYASLRHGLRQLTPIDACQCFQACNTQHNHTDNKPAGKGVY